jgi:hypothetical protein
LDALIAREIRIRNDFATGGDVGRECKDRSDWRLLRCGICSLSPLLDSHISAYLMYA